MSSAWDRYLVRGGPTSQLRHKSAWWRWTTTGWMQNLLPGLMGAVVTLASMQLGLGAAEGNIQRLLFQFRGAHSWDERLVLIKIDGESMEQLGWFPWSRDRYIALLDQLALSRDNIAVFNIVFSESTPIDTELSQSMEHHGQVVLSRAWDDSGNAWNPVPALTSAAMSVGDITHFVQKHELAYTAAPLQINGNPSLALSALQAYGLSNAIPELPPLDQPLHINWPAPVADLTQYSFDEVIAGNIPVDAFQDKIILIGATAQGLDPLATPFNPFGKASGIHFHGALLHTLLQGNELRPVSKTFHVLLALLLICLWGMMLVKLPTSKHLVSLGIALSAWSLICGLAFAQGNWLFPVLWPLLLLISTAGGTVVSNHFKLKQNHLKLKQQAVRDSVTKIYNRSYFDQQLSNIWEQATQNNHHVALLLCDIDHFKAYNDTYGHPAGDRCLYEVAQTLQQALKRSEEWVARYGGEEFAMVMPNSDLEGGIQLAKRIQQRLEQLALPHANSPTSPFVTLSLGIACLIPSTDTSIQQLIQEADQALYLAKQQGRASFIALRSPNKVLA